MKLASYVYLYVLKVEKSETQKSVIIKAIGRDVPETAGQSGDSTFTLI